MAGLLPLANSRARVRPRIAYGLALVGPSWLRLVSLLHARRARTAGRWATPWLRMYRMMDVVLAPPLVLPTPPSP